MSMQLRFAVLHPDEDFDALMIASVWVPTYVHLSNNSPAPGRGSPDSSDPIRYNSHMHTKDLEMRLR